MSTILTENGITFKELEKKIFEDACTIAREATKTILESYDNALMNARETKEYRNKGKRKTSIKTLYGEVEYARNVYEHINGDGKKEYIYLLDKEMQMDKIGLVSTNLAEKLAEIIIGNSYRVTSETISSTTGQTISHGGAWNIVQQLGEKVEKEEERLVELLEADALCGEIETPILFEEIDGVYLSMQGKSRGRRKSKEMKVSVAYTGWKINDRKRSRLVNKTAIASFDTSKVFHKKREAVIRNKYNTDEVELRVLNGDGAKWITEVYDSSTIIQLDKFHIYQEILRKIRDKSAAKNIRKLFDNEKIEEMFEYIKIYATSIESNDEKDKASSKAMELYSYLKNNEKGLIPYQKRGITIPKPLKGIEYKNMGVQENQNCTIITRRMKGRRMSWSERGANNLAKILCSKENKEISKIIERYSDGILPYVYQEEIKEVLSASSIAKRIGKGSKYIELTQSHMPMRDSHRTLGRRSILTSYS